MISPPVCDDLPVQDANPPGVEPWVYLQDKRVRLPATRGRHAADEAGPHCLLPQKLEQERDLDAETKAPA
jgi:hypothetical protein